MADWYSASISKEGEADKAANANCSSQPQLLFHARRSPVVCKHAAIATSQPLASQVGCEFLRKGANAADTAIATAAVLAVTEPGSTGLGGDMFCLYYHAASKSVSCVNGSGKSPQQLDYSKIQQAFPGATTPKTVDASKYRDSALAVTVPGAAAGWQDTLTKFGSGQFTLAELLEPAAKIAEEGFPVAPITSYHWNRGMSQITKWLSNPNERVPLAKAGTCQEAPQAGDIVVNPELARVLRDLGRDGAQQGFYQGASGQAIVDAVQKHGGCLTMDDLRHHTSTFPKPISATYRGYKLWQHPPNGQGIAGLIALSGLEHLESLGKVPRSTKVGSADSYHAMMEMMRLGFADARAHVTDLEHMSTTTTSPEQLLDVKRIAQRAEQLFDRDRAVIQGIPDASSCTVSFQVVDSKGNAISFVNSNFQGFGTGIIPDGCGFTLQNRGFGFTLQEDHPNCPAPSKRPYHTIIPALLTHADTNELYATLSNMGGNMQPQGHLQLTVDMIAGHLDPQAAIDRPRFCIADGTQDGVVSLEDGVSQEVVDELQRRGHHMKTGIFGHDRAIFGRAQIIKRDRTTGVLWAGSDGRADGCAMGF